MRKKEAIEKLKRQQSFIDELQGENDESPKFQRWHRNTDVAIKKVFGDKSGQHLQFVRILYHRGASWVEARQGVSHTGQYWKGLEEARSLLQSFIDEVEEYWQDEPTAPEEKESKEKPKLPEPVVCIEKICTRFHLIARQLRQRYNNRQTLSVEDEYDVQDLLHALLTLYFDDIRPEEWTPSYAGGSSRMDFLLKKERIVVEIKKTHKGLGAKEVGEQLLIDIQKYKEHPDCSTLFCFVYDPEERIANPRGIENDLNKTYDGLPVKVLITPTGL